MTYFNLLKKTIVVYFEYIFRKKLKLKIKIISIDKLKYYLKINLI